MKTSAGILLYRKGSKGVEVFLAHSGGPYYAKKDNGVWTIPKGELDEGEDELAAAKREYSEETGFMPPTGNYIDLGEVKASSKLNRIWAVEGSADETSFKSNTFEMEWPPRSGQKQTYPECDKGAWFLTPQAKQKLFKNQITFIERLEEALGVSAVSLESADEQISLF